MLNDSLRNLGREAYLQLNWKGTWHMKEDSDFLILDLTEFEAVDLKLTLFHTLWRMTDVQRDLTWLAFLLWEAGGDVMIYLYCWFSVLCSEVCSNCCCCFSKLMPEFYAFFFFSFFFFPPVAMAYFGWVWRVSHLSSTAMPPDHIATSGIIFFTAIHLYFRQSPRVGLVLKKKKNKQKTKNPSDFLLFSVMMHKAENFMGAVEI